MDLEGTFLFPVWTFQDFLVLIGNNKVCLLQNPKVIGTGYLVDSLYMLNTVNFNNEILHSSVRGTKRKLTEDSGVLWHKRLGHISKQRMQRLVDDGILDPLNLNDFEVCIECIKGKQTNIRKLGADKS